MKMRLLNACGLLAALFALFATDASAQEINLTGRYRCVHMCHPPNRSAYITQNGWELNLINEAGQPARGHIEWFTAGRRIWIFDWQEHALVYPDQLLIQFENGSIWRLRRP